MQHIDSLYGQVSDIARAYGLETAEQQRAVEEAYAVFREHSGPFTVSVAAEMLDDLRADVQRTPGRVVVFLGRDGHSLAAAVRGLDPEFFDRCCREVVLSRAIVDDATAHRRARQRPERPLPATPEARGAGKPLRWRTRPLRSLPGGVRDGPHGDHRLRGRTP